MQLTFNGINGVTGEYLARPEDPAALAQKLKGGGVAPLDANVAAAVRQKGAHLGVRHGIDERKLDQAGWGVVFPRDVDPDIVRALEPLLAHRRGQTGETLFKDIRDYAGASKDDFMDAYGAAPAFPVEPENLPYYLLLVGTPQQISFEFQQDIDLEHAVGRLDLDSADDYARYAEAVIRAETARSQNRQALFFGPANAGDDATQLSAEELVRPLATAFRDKLEIKELLRDQANKQALKDSLQRAPGLLFTASHGIGFPNGHANQKGDQGALVCQDWSGPGNGITANEYFGAADLDGVDLPGTIAFLFACYGGGTPATDDFAFEGEPEPLAPAAFVAALPKAMLQRGALAVAAHVDRAWGTSFLWRGRAQLETFRSAIAQIAEGYPAGKAMEFFNQQWANLSTAVAKMLDDVRKLKKIADEELVNAWTAKNDARGYVLLGDPAVRGSIHG